MKRKKKKNLRRRYKLQAPRYLISGGGTGGHIFPAIAIANALRSKNPDAVIEFVGAKNRMEMEKVPAAGYKIHGIWISGFQRRITFENLLFPLKVLMSLYRCFFILKKFKPNAVIGTGGFASGPLLKVACWLNIPTLIQEQNSYAGVTNKLLGKKVTAICLGFEKAKKYFPSDKCIVTGNPVRQSILNLPERQEGAKQLHISENKKTILVVGGSLGARTINKAIDQNMAKINEAQLQLVWQTGKNYEPQNLPEFGFATKFIEHMEYAYSACDYVISRAGAIAITELCIVGKPVILVPSPNVAEDHQTKNALDLVEHNAALMLRDHETVQNLWMALETLINDEALAGEIAANIKKLAKPHATDSIAEAVLKISNAPND